jgi:hypothetical protein
MLRIVDADVVVIAVASFHELALSDLWIAFGVGKHLRHLAIHVIAASMGLNKSRALLAFHAFTGSDQTSSFANRGKKTAWQAWEAWAVFSKVTDVFETPSISAVVEAMPVLKRYSVLMYNHTTTFTTCRIMCLYTELTSLKKSENETIMDYFIRVISDSLLIAMVLKGLPKTYKTFSNVVIQLEKLMSFGNFKITLPNH